MTTKKATRSIPNRAFMFTKDKRNTQVTQVVNDNQMDENKDVAKDSNVHKNTSTSMVQIFEYSSGSDDDLEFGDPKFVKET